jgi:photosystem II stability/assembly factor-like uncharacterized protein
VRQERDLRVEAEAPHVVRARQSHVGDLRGGRVRAHVREREARIVEGDDAPAGAREQARGGGDAVEPPARGLPATPDYHALFVFPDDPEHLLLGTHVGVYESTDGGVRWRFLGLEGRDAMHFAQDEDGTIWTAGHNVLERSSDGGRTWESVEPEGLPGLDIHGFTIDAEDGTFFAAVAGEGLYRSDDGGASFAAVSERIGPSVYALAIVPSGELYAADRETETVYHASSDGVEWLRSLEMHTAGLAANGTRLLAVGDAVQLSTGNDTWREVFDLEEGAGPVAFAPSDPEIAYLVGFDRKLYRSNDGGETWDEVA